MLTLETFSFNFNLVYFLWMLLVQLKVVNPIHWLEDTAYKFLFCLSFLIFSYYTFFTFTSFDIKYGIKVFPLCLSLFLRAGGFFVLLYENLIVKPKADFREINVLYIHLAFLILYSILVYVGIWTYDNFNITSFNFLDYSLEINKQYPFLYLGYFYIVFGVLYTGEYILDNYLYLDMSNKVTN